MSSIEIVTKYLSRASYKETIILPEAHGSMSERFPIDELFPVQSQPPSRDTSAVPIFRQCIGGPHPATSYNSQLHFAEIAVHQRSIHEAGYCR
jgi:hypothetical protein